MKKKLGLCSIGIALLLTLPCFGQELTQWEKNLDDEAKQTQILSTQLIGVVMKEYVKQNKRAFRDAHPRGIGCVEASFTVDPKLPAKYQTGVFATPGKSYDAIIRFSSSLGPVGDEVKDARGMAVKIFGVPGPKLLRGHTDAVTQDFLQIDAPTFPARDAVEFSGLVEAKLNPASIPGFLLRHPILRAREFKAIMDLTSNNPNNGSSLAERSFFSQTAYLLKGSSVNTPVKFASRPCGPVASVKLDGSKGELRNDLQARLKVQDLCFDFFLQFYNQESGHTVEDGMQEWKEADAPFSKFAQIRIPKQNFLTDEKLHYCDNLSFQPWHALAEHRPLGNINRVRRALYMALSEYRHKANAEQSALPEPTSLDAWRALKSGTYSEWDAVTIPQKINN
jgi:hypothetical protein